MDLSQALRHARPAGMNEEEWPRPLAGIRYDDLI
jgi:hypothetical protein